MPTAAHSAAAHRREDDLDAVHVGAEVGPWETQAHLGEQAEQQEVEAGDELHPSPIKPVCDTLSVWARGGFYKCVRVCVNNWPVARRVLERCATGRQMRERIILGIGLSSKPFIFGERVFGDV